MNFLYFYAAFAGTFLSVTLLSFFAWKEHDARAPKTLSQLAARNRKLTQWFRIVLWLCGTLFAITMYGLVIPNAENDEPLFIAWTTYYVSELLLAIFPAREGISKLLHNIFAYSMSLAMLATAALIAATTHGIHSQITLFIFLCMLILGGLTVIDRKRFIFYELPFIYLSHVSILVGVIALS